MSWIKGLGVLLAVVALVGCAKTPAPVPGPAPQDAARPEPAPHTTQGGPVGGENKGPDGFYPKGTKTGIAEVDRVIQALEKSDAATLEGLVALSKVGCTTQTQGMPGLPPCQNGEANGTQVQVFPALQCNVNYLRAKEQVAQMIKSRVKEPLLVYAVHKENSAVGDAKLSYAITVAPDSAIGRAQVINLDSNGAIRQWHGGCSQEANQLIPENAVFVLAPKK